MQHGALSMHDDYIGWDSVYKSDRNGIKRNAMGKTCFPPRLGFSRQKIFGSVYPFAIWHHLF